MRNCGFRVCAQSLPNDWDIVWASREIPKFKDPAFRSATSARSIALASPQCRSRDAFLRSGRASAACPPPPHHTTATAPPRSLGHSRPPPVVERNGHPLARSRFRLVRAHDPAKVREGARADDRALNIAINLKRWRCGRWARAARSPQWRWEAGTGGWLGCGQSGG
jgi:hypothetical protein